MPKNTVDDYSTDPAANLDIAGFSIAGTAPVSNFDNALRELMADIAATPLSADATAMRTKLGLDWRGAMVNLSADQLIPHNALTLLRFDQEVEDVGGWWTAGQPARLIVPAGVSRTRISLNIQWEANAMGIRDASILKNGERYLGGGSLRADATGNGKRMNLSCASVPTLSGDFFEVEVLQNSGVSLNIRPNTGTWLAIEANSV